MTLGFWSMLYDPIHFAVFVVLCCLVPVLLYTAYILHSLYLVMGEAYIDVSNAMHTNSTVQQCDNATCLMSCSQFVLSRGRESYSEDEDEEPLDFRRISV